MAANSDNNNGSVGSPTSDNDEENQNYIGGGASDQLQDDFVSLDPINNDDDDYDDENDICTEDKENGVRDETGNIIGSSSATYNRFTDLPPWMKEYVDYRHVNHVVALHNEIVAFCKVIEPVNEELKQRQDLVDRFTALAKSTFANEECQVDVFGSQATGLCLPTSDIDIAIQIKEEEKKEEVVIEKAKKKKKKKKKNGANGTGEAGNVNDIETNWNMVSKQQELYDLEYWDRPSGTPLQRLATALREYWLNELSYLEVIENTRVPLVKFTHAPTNISIDVCFNQKNGPQAALLMHQYMEALPPLRPLTFVLKKFIASRGLHQPYTGGVGSFLLQMMIVSFLQHRERDSFNNKRPSLYILGALLIEFLEFYSTDFNFITTGISVRFDGFYFPKGAADRKKDFWQPQRPFSIALENPLDPSFDVGTPSFRINTVQRSFEIAFKTLLCHVSEPVYPTLSILASILPPSSYEEMWDRSGILGKTVAPHRVATMNGGQSGSTSIASVHEPPRKRQRHE